MKFDEDQKLVSEIYSPESERRSELFCFKEIDVAQKTEMIENNDLAPASNSNDELLSNQGFSFYSVFKRAIFSFFYGIWEVTAFPLRVVTFLLLFPLGFIRGFITIFAKITLSKIGLGIVSRLFTKVINFIFDPLFLWVAMFFNRGFTNGRWLIVFLFVCPLFIPLTTLYEVIGDEGWTASLFSPALWPFLRSLHAIWWGMRCPKGSGRHFLGKGKSWTDTKNMSTMEVASLNDRFERATADAFRNLGFRCQVNGTQFARSVIGHKGPGDTGVDVFASNGSEVLLISCKRYAANVEEELVRDIFSISRSKKYPRGRAAAISFGMSVDVKKDKDYSTAVLVTTTGFTRGALAFAKENGVRLYLLSEGGELRKIN